MGLIKRSYIVFVIVSIGLVSCIKEVELGVSDASYLYIDGNIEIGENIHRLKLGQTKGVNFAIPDPVGGIEVVVKDYTNQEEYLFQEVETGTYEGAFEGKLETDYQLFLYFQNGETFATDTLRLSQTPLVGFSGEVKPRTRFSPGGDSVVTNIATAAVEFQLSNQRSNDLLVTRSRFEFSVSDLICNPFDSASKCYFKDDLTVDQFGLIDLSRFGKNEEGAFLSGNYGIDARMAEESVLIVGIFRVDEQAKPYYQSIASAVELGSSFFSPQPLTIPGNLVEVNEGAKSALGYFGVIERTELVLSANSREIKERAGLAYCMGGSADFMQWDCCFCFRNLGGVTDRPSYWP